MCRSHINPHSYNQEMQLKHKYLCLYTRLDGSWSASLSITLLQIQILSPFGLVNHWLKHQQWVKFFSIYKIDKKCDTELLTVYFSDECALQLNRHIYFGDISMKLDRFFSPVHTLAYYYSQILFGEANTWVKFCCEIFLNPWLFFRDFSIFLEHINEPRRTATSIRKCFYSTRKGQVFVFLFTSFSHLSLLSRCALFVFHSQKCSTDCFYNPVSTHPPSAPTEKRKKAWLCENSLHIFSLKMSEIPKYSRRVLRG